MTTVVATTELICADSLCSHDAANFYVDKIVRARKSILAGAGNVNDILAFYQWFKGAKRKRSGQFTADSCFDILEVNREGIWLWDQQLIPIRVQSAYHAVGSGAQYALAALDFGNTPQQAVAYAATRDHKTGQPVLTMTLQKLKKPRGKRNR